jgi:Predicted signal transduction protein with a C-terminal ATPase domain
VNLPPLLFISFIENAFKHGVSYREPSALTFKMIQNTDSIEFIAVNTISAYSNGDSLVNHGGFGLENIKKRLDLLYGDKHQLIINKTDHEFNVKLIIPT